MGDNLFPPPPLKTMKRFATTTNQPSKVLCFSRNDIIFDKSPIKSLMQVLYRAMYWPIF
jgi:hypothetical protein